VSKAFTKEDDEIPERPARVRSSSGLPPGAVNYMTAKGERRLRNELEELLMPKRARKGGAAKERIAEFQRVLTSATIVPEPETPADEVLFGATVTVRGESGELARYRIVGADETKLAPGWVSWLSPLAKALIGARVGDRLRLAAPAPEEEVVILKIEY